MNQPILSVVIPAHNEEGSIEATVRSLVLELCRAKVPHEILIVDDHSTDATSDLLERLAAEFVSVRWVSNGRPGGFGQAVHTGMDAYIGDAFCLVMADGSEDPQDVVRYYGKLLEGYECVFGTRFDPESTVRNYPRHKLALNRAANLFIRVLFGLQYNDFTNAFKCYRRSVIDGIRPILSHHFNLTVELPLKAIVRGYTYAIVPTSWYGRVHGISKLRIQEMGSRYLFIVLYVFLERLLSRGDYVRKGYPIEIERLSPPRKSASWAWLALATVLVVQSLFAVTYPMNHRGGDTPGYEYVLLHRTSNLLFAPGYMFLAGLPLRVDFIHDAAMKHPEGFRETLQLLQHIFEVACLAILLVALTRVYNQLTAFLAVLFAGMSARAMGATSSFYPEWLQADLLILTLAFALLAFKTEPGRVRKVLFYSGAFVSFVWCVLTKFNAVVFLPGLLLIVFCDSSPWRHRLRLFSFAALMALANYLGFVMLVHRPETGTMALTRDRSWVLLAKVAQVYGKHLPFPSGIHTKRWLALSAVVPPSYDQASIGIFMREDGNAEARRRFIGKVAPLLTADESQLDETLRRNHLPASFNLGASSIPITFYVGLKESDELGVRVFRESIWNVPRPYLSSVWQESVKTLTLATTEPTFPSANNVVGPDDRLVPIGGNWFRLVVDPSSPVQFRADRNIIWGPGFRFFSFLERAILSRAKTVLLMAVGIFLAAAYGWAKGWRPEIIIPIGLGLLLLGFDVFSNAVLQFRWKEWRLAYPMAVVVIAITLGWTLPAVYRLFVRRDTA